MAVLTMYFIYFSIPACVLYAFFKIGDLDDEIGGALGLGTGMMVLVLHFLVPGGYVGLVLYSVGGFILLTIYKILRGLSKKKGRKTDEDFEQRD
jgi:hypothetical protein